MWTQVSFVLSQCTPLRFDRQTDGQTDIPAYEQKGLRNTMRCIICSHTVKIKVIYVMLRGCLCALEVLPTQ